MAANKVDLILHPVRLRILTAMSGRELSPQQVASMLPDVAQATLYRHINALYEGGLLTVVEERRVRGTLEKVYGLSSAEELNLTEADLQDASKEDHVRYFTTFLATLMAEFTRYLNAQAEVQPAQDGVGYHTVPLVMSDEELMTFGEGLRALMQPYLEDGRQRHDRNDCKRRLFSFVIMPAADEQTQDSRES